MSKLPSLIVSLLLNPKIQYSLHRTSKDKNDQIYFCKSFSVNSPSKHLKQTGTEIKKPQDTHVEKAFMRSS